MKYFEHTRVESFDEASELLKDGKAAVIAGGSDLLGVIKNEILEESPQMLIDIKNIEGEEDRSKMMPGQKHRIHYAWVTLGGTCVMMAIGFGMALNSMGVFFPAVAEYLGTPATASVCERGAASAEGLAAASVCERGAASAEGLAAASAGDGRQGGTDRGQTCGSVTEYGVTLKEAQHRPSFYLVIFVAAALTWAGGMNSHFPTHSRTLGFGTEVGSFMSSACLVMQLLFNVPLGMIIDRFGVKSAVCLYSSVAAAGSLLLCGATARWALFLASMLYGVGMCQTMVVTSLLTRTIFGRKEYGRIQAVVMTAFGLSGALGYTINGYLLDLTGSYQISFAVTALCDLAAIGACVLALRLEKEQIRANEALEGVLV